MKIVDERNTATKLFGELNAGDTFICDKKLYVKSEDCDVFNSFCITDSRIICFADPVLVVPVECEAIIWSNSKHD